MPTPYSPSGRQGDALPGHLLAEELVRDLDQDPGAVAGQRVGAGGAPMGEVLEDLEALLDDGVALLALECGDEADAAGIVLVGGVVQALGLGWCILCHSRTSSAAPPQLITALNAR